MKKLSLGTLIVVAALMVAVAPAQSVRHDKMDARAARADIVNLKADRKMARHMHNWKKVQQDNRLIAADQKFLRKDVRKVRRAHGM